MEYKKFKTECYKCGKKFYTIQFLVHIGCWSFTLCPKHLEQFKKITEKWIYKK